MSLATIRRDGPEISDAIVSFDPITLERKPVKKSDVLAQFTKLGNHEAVRVVQKIPERDGALDPAAVDKILITSHCEMQRMSEEFQHGRRVSELLKPILDALRSGGVQNPIRIVDIGCGTGFVIRWLSAKGSLGNDVELLGVDFNVALVNEAQRLEKRALSFTSIFTARRWRRWVRGSFTPCACANRWRGTTACSQPCARTRVATYST